MEKNLMTPNPDDDETLEGCVDQNEDGSPEDIMADEDLPVAEGGVA